MEPHIVSAALLYEGHHLNFRELLYEDPKGIQRRWESVDRCGEGGAVFILAHIVPDDEILLVRQFRPPSGRYMIEFPAGLIDPGESAETTAHRELMEETGYKGKLLFLTSPGFSSPGLTGESITLAAMEVDGNYYQTHAPTPCPEECENIDVLRVKVPDLGGFIARMEQQGCGIDTKLHTLVSSLRMGMLHL